MTPAHWGTNFGRIAACIAAVRPLYAAGTTYEGPVAGIRSPPSAPRLGAPGAPAAPAGAAAASLSSLFTSACASWKSLSIAPNSAFSNAARAVGIFSTATARAGAGFPRAADKTAHAAKTKTMVYDRDIAG